MQRSQSLRLTPHSPLARRDTRSDRRLDDPASKGYSRCADQSVLTGQVCGELSELWAERPVVEALHVLY